MEIHDDLLLKYCTAKHQPGYIDFQYNLALTYARYFKDLEIDIASALCPRCMYIHQSGPETESEHTCRNPLRSKDDRYNFYRQNVPHFITLVDQEAVTEKFVNDFVRLTRYDSLYIPIFFKQWEYRHILFEFTHFVHWICKLMLCDFDEDCIKSDVEYFQHKHLNYLKGSVDILDHGTSHASQHGN